MFNESQRKTGGIIAAAKRKVRQEQAHALLQLGSISAIKRIVLTFQLAGVDPIVIITGYDADVIERELHDYGVIFLYKDNYEQSQLFHLATFGMKYLQNKCDQIMFTPVDIPLFSPDTLKKMMVCNKEITSPSYHHKCGHPILISNHIIPKILEYDGDDGMRGAVRELQLHRKWVEVDDEGIVHCMDNLEQKSYLIQNHNQHIARPYLQISLEKEDAFFDNKTKLLLTLIQETNSVKSACKHMALSYSKAWKMLNLLEKELQFPVVTRQQGGNQGGNTYLTPEGEQMLRNYELFEKRIREYALEQYRKIFVDPS